MHKDVDSIFYINIQMGMNDFIKPMSRERERERDLETTMSLLWGDGKGWKEKIVKAV